MNITEIRTRSPYLLISTGTTFTESVFTIKQFEGDIDNYLTQPISYTKTKQKIIPSQNNIFINISNLVREDLEGDIANYIDYTVVKNIGSGETKWVNVETVNKYLSTGTTTGNTFYFVTDGYIEPGETQILPQLLITGDKRKYAEAAKARIHYKTSGYNRTYSFDGTAQNTYYSSNYVGVNTMPTIRIESADSTKSNEYIKSIIIDTYVDKTYLFCYNTYQPNTWQYYMPNYLDIPIWNTVTPDLGPFESGFQVIWGGKVWINTGGPTGLSGSLGYAIDELTLGGEFEFEGDIYPVWVVEPYTSFVYTKYYANLVNTFIEPNCKYENYNLVFKNKYGVLETISMNKKSTKTLNVESTDYLRSIVDLEGSYNINRHTKKQFNVGGMEEWTLNTGMLPEYMNEPIKQAMLTEEMWLIDSFDKIIPVIKMDENITFKTSLNDKMIQYTIKVGLSHNTIQNIL